MARQSRAKSLVDAIEQEIVTGQLRPGTRLDEASLSARFSVSRTPVREALIQLASKGLVELQANRGAFVRQTSPMRLIEMFEVMAELESMCARLAARRITPRGAQALLASNKACEEAADAGDADAYYYANATFHQVIYDISGNSFLAEQAKQLQERLQPYRRLPLRIGNRMRSSLNEHNDIVQAITNGDTAAAAELLRAHVLIQGERFSDFFAALAQQPQ